MRAPLDPLPALKRQLADQILWLVDGWSQTYAASLLGSWQPRVSELRAGHLHRFSLDRLVRLLAHLGHEVAITTTPTRKSMTLRDPARDQSACTRFEPGAQSRSE